MVKGWRIALMLGAYMSALALVASGTVWVTGHQKQGLVPQHAIVTTYGALGALVLALSWVSGAWAVRTAGSAWGAFWKGTAATFALNYLVLAGGVAAGLSILELSGRPVVEWRGLALYLVVFVEVTLISLVTFLPLGVLVGLVCAAAFCWKAPPGVAAPDEQS